MRQLLKKYLPPNTFQKIKRSYNAFQYSYIPCWKPVHRLLYLSHQTVIHLWQNSVQKLYFTPLFLSQITNSPEQIHLYSGMPQLLGALKITIGERCRISGISTWSGRISNADVAEIQIGDNVDIGWQNILASGTQIQIDDNARLAGKVFLAGYPGHPENAEDRAKGKADTPIQIGRIHIKKNAWIGTGAIILANVTIGEGSIVAAGSIVTHNIPNFVLVAGNPARIMRSVERA